jgi:hypothetical protein
MAVFPMIISRFKVQNDPYPHQSRGPPASCLGANIKPLSLDLREQVCSRLIPSEE